MKTPDATFAVNPVRSATQRIVGHGQGWQRALERAQWAGLGEHSDRSSPTSAIEERPEEVRKALAAAKRGTLVPAHPLPVGSASSIHSNSGIGAGASGGHGFQAGAVAAGIKSTAIIASELPPDRGGDEVHETTRFALPCAAPLDVASHDTALAPARRADPALLGDRPEPLPARSMHLFMSPDGALVFIRDAAVNDSSIGALVAQLSAQLAATGMRLATLTVNGRRVYEASQTSNPNDPLKEAPHGD